MSNEDLSDTNMNADAGGPADEGAAEGAPNVADAVDAAEALFEGEPPADLKKSLDDFAASLNRFSDTVDRATNVIIDVAAKMMAQATAYAPTPAKRRGRPPGKKTAKRKGKRR